MSVGITCKGFVSDPASLTADVDLVGRHLRFKNKIAARSDRK